MGFAGLLSTLKEVSVLRSGVWQFLHFLSEALVSVTPHSQVLVTAARLKLSPNTVEDVALGVVLGVLDVSESWAEVTNPGLFKISKTLPSFNTLAGLKGPSNSNLLSLEVLTETAGTILPFEREGKVFIVGLLKVKSTVEEQEGGLAAVATTLGGANVKEIVVDTESSLLTAGFSELQGIRLVLEVVRLEEEVCDGKLKVGRLHLPIGNDTAGKSGNSTTSSSVFLDEGRTLRSRFILPPPVPARLVAGVLDSGYNILLVLAGADGTASGMCGVRFTGVSFVFFSNVLLTWPGVSEGRKGMKRFPDTTAAAGVINLATGGTTGSNFFLLMKLSESEWFDDVDKGDETLEGIRFASARGLDMRSSVCKMRLAVALVTPHGCAPAGLAFICLLTGA